METKESGKEVILLHLLRLGAEYEWFHKRLVSECFIILRVPSCIIIVEGRRELE